MVPKFAFLHFFDPNHKLIVKVNKRLPKNPILIWIIYENYPEYGHYGDYLLSLPWYISNWPFLLYATYKTPIR
jgi:hypothetical protein